ncbi:hypothetical protein DKX38_015515 [Salix brachista]|uniref:Uncharacterized protein n=1 Tax=Salix brachista TaxID=2182728 RepID=A0A5N5L5M0_9ROSI|nr:hypothetical protein DKX38_015515 [Salix brachista]
MWVQGSHGTGGYPSIVSFLHYRMDLDSKMYACVREWLLKLAGDVNYWIKNIVMQLFKVSSKCNMDRLAGCSSPDSRLHSQAFHQGMRKLQRTGTPSVDQHQLVPFECRHHSHASTSYANHMLISSSVCSPSLSLFHGSMHCPIE